MVLTLLIPQTVYGQVMETSHRIDTLSAADRLSFRTNGVEWLILVPNIGIEYDLGRYNYSRWSIGLNLRYNWQTSHTFKPGAIFNVAEARLELRDYYRIREFTNYITPKKGFLNKLLSPRRETAKHPNTTYYRGAFAAYNKFTVKLGSEGHQGNAIIGGFMWGMMKPLYVFRRGHSLDLEFGVAVGVAYAKYDTFTHDAFLDYYPKTGNKTTILPVINDLRVGFVYRPGKYPITKKYRWRYDVDMNYQSDNYVRKLFWEKYDSITNKHRIAEDSLRLIGQDEKSLKRLEKENRKAKIQADKEAAKEEERQARRRLIREAAREARKEAEKSNSESEAEEPEKPATTTEEKEEKGGES